MRQALHIFLKDSRQFRLPVAVLLVWTVVFAVAGAVPWPTTPGRDLSEPTRVVILLLAHYLFPIAWCYLIAQTFHADALPGERQFWLTRPYHRGSLFAAKAMFVLAYVTIPLTLAQAAIVVFSGLPLIPNLAGLVWEQVLVTAVVVLPAAAVAATTSTLAQFVIAAFVAPVLFLFSTIVTAMWPWAGLEWIRSSFLVCAIVVITGAMLVVQFRHRRTSTSRLIALAGILAVLAALPVLPWRPAFALQSKLAGAWDGTLTAELGPPEQPAPARFRTMSRGIALHFRVAGPPDNPPIVCEAREITIESPAGPIWRTGAVSADRTRDRRFLAGGCQMGLVMPASFLDAVADSRVRLRAVLYITVFGSERSTRVPLGQPPMTIPDVGSCAGGNYETFTFGQCRAVFRFPRFMVDSPAGMAVWSEGHDYSPFPAELTLAPIYSGGIGFPSRPVDHMTISTRAPVAHVRTVVEATDVRLRDFEFQR